MNKYEKLGIKKYGGNTGLYYLSPRTISINEIERKLKIKCDIWFSMSEIVAFKIKEV